MMYGPYIMTPQLLTRLPQVKLPEAKAGIVFVKDVSMDKLLHMDKCR